jgi:hypothetical protein
MGYAGKVENDGDFSLPTFFFEGFFPNVFADFF